MRGKSALPVAAILNAEQEKRHSWLQRQLGKVCKSRFSALATDVLRYTQQASGRIPIPVPGGYSALIIVRSTVKMSVLKNKKKTSGP
ncbi:hypothetical protein [Pantoea ananatis]|uniref:hypothetical protein n=1 Tax=Pantoea ananas TaxID=553 RepID=UPI001B30B324|nr:hypothetical protein [Pantoea ananatis]